MQDFQIPAGNDNVGNDNDHEPPEDPSTGVHMVDAMACATLASLPQDAHVMSGSTKPSHSPYPQRPEDREILMVNYCPKADLLRAPQPLLDMEWNHTVSPQECDPTDFLEGGIGSACAESYSTVAMMISQQMPKTIKLHVKPFCQQIPGSKRQTDFTIVVNAKNSSSIEHKITFGGDNDCFTEFPFSGETRQWKLLKNVKTMPKELLEQVIQYGRDAVKNDASERILVALALPPLAFYYILVDFPEQKVTVFSNAVAPNSEVHSTGLTIGQMVRSHPAWCAYWRTVLWFFIIVSAVKCPSEIKNAFGRHPQRKFPAEVEPSLQEAVGFLGEAPPLGLWACLSLWYIRLMRSIHTIYMLCITFAWQTTGAPAMLKSSQYLKIPQTGTVDLQNGYSFWRHAILPDCAGRWSECGTKRFYVYPKLKLFIKIFSCAARKGFETEIEIFNTLSEIQGTGIPKLYACGKVIESGEFYLVMSYEGEPLKHWTAEDRQQVEKLVRLLHQYQIHHHDVARRNVVVDERGKFTLIDFEQSKEGCSNDQCTEGTDLGMRGKDELSDYLT